MRTLYKIKRRPATTYVLVIMASEEKRNSKPYALHIQYIPYKSPTCKTIDILALLDQIKKKMKNMGTDELYFIGKYAILDTCIIYF